MLTHRQFSFELVKKIVGLLCHYGVILFFLEESKHDSENSNGLNWENSPNE